MSNLEDKIVLPQIFKQKGRFLGTDNYGNDRYASDYYKNEDVEEYIETVERCLSALADDWISVDTPPEKDGEYLTQSSGYGYRVMKFEIETGLTPNSYNVWWADDTSPTSSVIRWKPITPPKTLTR